MALVVNTNIASLNAQRNLGISNSQLGKSLEKLSSGLRINRAADDAAGLAIATKFSAQVKGLNQAVRNSNNAISLVQTAEGGVNTLTNIMQRLRELAVQSSSDDNTPADRATLTSEASNLISEFTRISNTTEFNTMALLDGTFSGKYFQVGANFAQLVTFNIGDARGKSLGGRAEMSADVADGVLNATNANFGAGAFKVNTYDVGATDAADDQYSVIDLSSSQINSTNLTLASITNANAITGITSTVTLGSVLKDIQSGMAAGVDFASLNQLAEAESYVGTGTTLAASLADLVASIQGRATMVYTMSGALTAFVAGLSVGNSLLTSFDTLDEVSTWVGNTWGLKNVIYASALASAIASINTAGAGNSATSFGSFAASHYDQTIYTALNQANNVRSLGQLTTSWFNGTQSYTVQSATGNFTVGANSGAVVSYVVKLTVNGVAISLQYNVSVDNSVANSGISYGSNLALLTRTTSYAVAGSTLAADIASAIANNASLIALNVTARPVNGSGWVIERTGGGELQILASLYVGVNQGTGADSTATIADSKLFSLIGAQNLMSGIVSAIGNGNDLTATTAPTIYNGESSAIAKAVAINTVKSDSKVTATAQKNEFTGGTAIAALTIASGDIYINGVDIGSATVTASDSTGALVSAINNKSNDTGVVASKTTDGKLKLTAADGRNISITTSTAGTAGNVANSLFGDSTVTTYFTNNTAIFRSTVKLNSESNISLTGTLSELYDEADDVTKTDDSSKSVATDLATYNIAALSISTQDDAQAAILTIDAALNGLNSLRSRIGAIQNRIEFTVSNLETASENMSASESRIRDADFAYETARFTRNQIMVQAGAAMLAQANTLQQVALQLLK